MKFAKNIGKIFCYIWIASLALKQKFVNSFSVIFLYERSRWDTNSVELTAPVVPMHYFPQSHRMKNTFLKVVFV